MVPQCTVYPLVSGRVVAVLVLDPVCLQYTACVAKELNIHVHFIPRVFRRFSMYLKLNTFPLLVDGTI